MATTIIKEGQPGSRAWFRDPFVLHKLHSLSGIFPIGFFMIQHLLANSYSLRGETEFNTVVKVFGYLPFVGILEIGIIFVPLLFHAIYGFFITAEMRSNVGVYQYGRNWLYYLQRWSGVVAFVYICYHTYSTTLTRRLYEWSGSPNGHELGFRAIAYDAMAWRLENPVYLIFYVVCITAAAFHLANGLFNFGIRWGITVGAAAQKISAYLWAGLGILLAIIGCWTAINFSVIGHQRDLRGQYQTLDALVHSEPAPAEPTPGAKPAPSGQTPLQ